MVSLVPPGYAYAASFALGNCIFWMLLLSEQRGEKM